MLVALAIGALAYSLTDSNGIFTSEASAGTGFNGNLNNEQFQRAEMRTFGLRPKDNIGYGTNVLELENAPQIIRTADKHNLRDVRGNSTDFLESARQRNQYLGDMHWDKKNRKTIIFPSYNSKVVTVNVPTPEAVPFYYKIPGAYPDRPSGEGYKDNDPRNYIEMYADNVEAQSGYPQSGITSIEKFGNAWGPGGVINRAMIEGGTRGDRVGMYKDVDPLVPKIAKKSVKFATGTKLY